VGKGPWLFSEVDELASVINALQRPICEISRALTSFVDGEGSFIIYSVSILSGEHGRAMKATESSVPRINLNYQSIFVDHSGKGGTAHDIHLVLDGGFITTTKQSSISTWLAGERRVHIMKKRSQSQEGVAEEGIENRIKPREVEQDFRERDQGTQNENITETKKDRYPSRGRGVVA
jgi:hypothetical protein